MTEEDPSNFQASICLSETTTQRNPALFEPRLDVSSLNNCLGIVKIVQLLLEIICLGLISPPVDRSSRLFLILVVFVFVFTILTSATHLCAIEDTMRLRFNNWCQIKIMCLVFLMVFYTIACIILFDYWANEFKFLNQTVVHKNRNLYLVAGVLGILNVVSLGFEGVILFKNVRNQ